MILAAAACAEDPRLSPPDILSLAWQCRAWRALPEAGGVLDQPVGLLSKMTALDNIYNVWNAFIKAPDMARWKAQHPREWSIVAEVLKHRG